MNKFQCSTALGTHADRRHGDNPWASARQRPARPAGACAEWCRWSVGGDRGGGPWRQVGPRLGSWLRYDGAQQPGPDHRRPKEGMDHRRLPPVEQTELPGCLPGALPPPDCEVLSSARCRWSTPTTLRQCHCTENIGRKVQSYKYVDAAKGLGNNLRMKDVAALKEKQSNRCAACNIELLWCYEPKDTRQFSVDRIDNAKGHTRDNVRLACLECNQKRGAAGLTHHRPACSK